MLGKDLKRHGVRDLGKRDLSDLDPHRLQRRGAVRVRDGALGPKVVGGALALQVEAGHPVREGPVPVDVAVADAAPGEKGGVGEVAQQVVVLGRGGEQARERRCFSARLRAGAHVAPGGRKLSVT